MSDRPQIITLCGSTAFQAQFAEVMAQLTLAGHIVIGPGVFGTSSRFPDRVQFAAVKEALDDLHRRKIDLADSVFIVNAGGYIGESTRAEIAYAREAGKPVAYLEPPPLAASIAEAEAMEARDRAAGGPPWEVADHPDHALPGGWHRGQIR